MELPCWLRHCACDEGSEGNEVSYPSAGLLAPVVPDVREEIGGDASSRQMVATTIQPQLTDRYLPNYFIQQLF